MASGVRYRYKGKFISAAKAAKIGNLQHAKSYLKSSYPIKGKASKEYTGYKKAVAVQVREAIREGRQKAERKIAERVRPEQLRIARKHKRDFIRETRRAADWARKTARYALEENIDIGDALDDLGFDEAGFQFFDYGEMESAVSGYMEMGADFFEFEMADLDDEEKYHP